VLGPESFLSYERFRYLWVSLAGLAAALALYASSSPVGGRNGGTWVGTTLGVVCVFLILWLMWFGVRKRQYGTRSAPLKGWLSAHVYIGTILLVLVPLHSAFQFGWNVHTLAYVLLAGVILSGICGVIAYAALPNPKNTNRRGRKISSLLEQIARGDEDCQNCLTEIESHCSELGKESPEKAADLQEEFEFYRRAVAMAVDMTEIGGGRIRQLLGTYPNCGTARALDAVRDRAAASPYKSVGDLTAALVQRKLIVDQVRRATLTGCDRDRGRSHLFGLLLQVTERLRSRSLGPNGESPE
jgi:hypothetical protein